AGPQEAAPTPIPTGPQQAAPVPAQSNPPVPAAPGINPRALAAAGVLAGLGGIGDAFKPLESFYYNSPGYKAQVAGAEANAGVPAANAKARFQQQLDITKAAPVAQAQAAAKVSGLVAEAQKFP